MSASTITQIPDTLTFADLDSAKYLAVGNADDNSTAKVSVPVIQAASLPGIYLLTNGASGAVKYSTLQSAVAAAQSGDTILVRGTDITLTAAIVLSSGVTLKGENAVLRTASHLINLVEVDGGSDIVISGVSFVGASTNQGEQTDTSGCGVRIYNSSTRVRVSSCVFEKLATGVRIDSSSAVSVSENVMKKNSNSGIKLTQSDKCDIAENVIDNDRTGVGDGVLGKVGIWLLGNSTYTSPTTATIIRDNIVSNVLNECINISGGTRCSILGNSIDTCDNGIISEHFPNSPIVDTLSGSFNTFDGNQIKNAANTGIHIGTDTGTEGIAAHDCIIINNIIDTCKYGITIKGENADVNSRRPINCIVSNNRLRNISDDNAIILCSDNTIVANNVVASPTKNCLQMNYCRNTQITGNIFLSAGEYGIRLLVDNRDTNIIGNQIIGATIDGIHLSGTSVRTKISFNTLQSNTAWGIDILSGAASTTLIGNSFYANGSGRVTNNAGTETYEYLTDDNGGAGGNFPMGALRMTGTLSLMDRRVTRTVATLSNNSATPTVSGGETFKASNNGITTITNFAGGTDGHRITIHFTNGNTTVQHGANISLEGGVDFVGAANAVLTLEYRDSAWYEIARRTA